MSNRRVQMIRKHVLASRHKLAGHIDADEAARELRSLSDANGGLTPQIVVEAARNPNSALHPAFDWDDSEAAEKWRLEQARTLIRSVKVVTSDSEPSSVFVHVPSEMRQVAGTYQPIERVVRVPSLYAAALAEASRRLEAAHEGVEELRRAAQAQPEADQDRLAKIAALITTVETAKALATALH